MSPPRQLHPAVPGRAASPLAGAPTRAGTGAPAANSGDALAFRALLGQVSRHSGARQVSVWTGEAQAEAEGPPAPRHEPLASRPTPAPAGPAVSRGSTTLTRECVVALVPLLSGPPREGRFQLLLPGGRVLEIHYRSSDRRALVRLQTRHRATARHLVQQAESLAIRLGRECLKEVLVQVDEADDGTDPEAEARADARADAQTDTRSEAARPDRRPSGA